MTSTEELIKMENEYGAHNYHPLPVVISQAEGVWVYDPEGNKYMDMLSCYSAVNQGHRHPKIIEAAKKQLDRLTLTSRAFCNDMLGPFLKKIVELTGMEVALPMNTGAEAVETAIKIARRWGYMVKGVEKDKAEIIVCENNFHGRTTTIVGFSSDEGSREGFGPFTPGFKMIPFNDTDALENAITDNTVAFLVEPIQGEAGVIIPDDDYLVKVRKICDEHNVLLIADEIQTGFGRTGKMFAHEHSGIKPDMMTLGKAISGGILPVSVVVTYKRIMDVITPGSHGSTFGGNPLGAAVSMAAIDVLTEERLPDRAKELGEYFMDKLKKIDIPFIKEVRGKGLLIAIEIEKGGHPARYYTEKLKKYGILAKETHDWIIRFAPGLIVTKEELDWAAEQIEKALKE